MPKHWFNHKFDSKKIILLILYYYCLVRAMHTSGGGLVVNCLSRSLEQLNLLLLSSGINLAHHSPSQNPCMWSWVNQLKSIRFPILQLTRLMKSMNSSSLPCRTSLRSTRRKLDILAFI
uniref:Uncharacterized protein n=1 Tax=Zea mays TaxID=4577 RepID=A0A804N5G7_MAIZE